MSQAFALLDLGINITVPLGNDLFLGLATHRDTYRIGLVDIAKVSEDVYLLLLKVVDVRKIRMNGFSAKRTNSHFLDPHEFKRL
jgi:hypothetical protein